MQDSIPNSSVGFLENQVIKPLTECKSAIQMECLQVHGNAVDHFGWIQKAGRFCGLRSRRFIVLKDRFMYEYKNPADSIPCEAWMIVDCRVEKVIGDSRDAHGGSRKCCERY